MYSLKEIIFIPKAYICNNNNIKKKHLDKAGFAKHTVSHMINDGILVSDEFYFNVSL